MRFCVLILFVGLSFGAVSAARADESPNPDPEVEVFFVDQVGLPSAMTEAIRKDLQEIYQDAGVRVSWFKSQAGTPGHPVTRHFVRVVLAWKRTFANSFFRSNKDRSRTVLGAGWKVAGEQQISPTVLLPYEDLLEASRNNPTSPAGAPTPLFTRVMARVIAHEMGHVLLNRTGHSQSGLMRDHFERQLLCSPFNQAFTFNHEDAADVRRAANRPLRNAADTQGK